VPSGWGLKSYPLAGRLRAKTGVPSFFRMRREGVDGWLQRRFARKRYPGAVAVEYVTEIFGNSTVPPVTAAGALSRSCWRTETEGGNSTALRAFFIPRKSGMRDAIENEILSDPPARNTSVVSIAAVTSSPGANGAMGVKTIVRESSETEVFHAWEPVTDPEMPRSVFAATAGLTSRSPLRMSVVAGRMNREPGRGDTYMRRIRDPGAEIATGTLPGFANVRTNSARTGATNRLCSISPPHEFSQNPARHGAALARNPPD